MPCFETQKNDQTPYFLVMIPLGDSISADPLLFSIYVSACFTKQRIICMRPARASPGTLEAEHAAFGSQCKSAVVHSNHVHEFHMFFTPAGAVFPALRHDSQNTCMWSR